MKSIKEILHSVKTYIVSYFRWIFVGCITGIICGLVGYVFHHCVELATEIRMEHSWLIWLLPVAGLVIVLLYKSCRMLENGGTNNVITSVKTNEKVPLVLAPLIFAGTVITHLFGGSAGREGAALQLGGSIGFQVGKLFRLEEKSKNLVVMCGMAGVFSALFGTPLTATVFCMEVASVGLFYYAGLIPCLISSLTAYGIASYFGAAPVHFDLAFVPGLSVISTAQVAVLGALCAGVSIIFCLAMHKTGHFLKDKITNPYLRIFAGGAAVVVLTLLVGNTDYNGAGMQIVEQAIVGGNAKWYAFLLKIIFTALTIGAGFRGGEIVPTFFIGSTFGCVAGSLLGMDPGFGAAIGFIALFCAVVNCPLASIVLAVEVFGSEGLLLFAVACGTSYLLSGYFGLYSSQKIMYSKLRAEYIHRDTE